MMQIEVSEPELNFFLAWRCSEY